MAEPQVPPSAQVVAHEFVKQYYTMLHTAPDFLHRFYSHNSSFMHGDDHSAVTGQADIHKKILSLKFENCHARICQVDSQSSVAGSVVVQVIGELSNADQPMRRFVQSFVLAPQTTNKYYVHVDIFRYQDDYVSVNEGEVIEDVSEKVKNEDNVEPTLKVEAPVLATDEESTSEKQLESVESSDVTEVAAAGVNAVDSSVSSANGDLAKEEKKDSIAVSEANLVSDTVTASAEVIEPVSTNPEVTVPAPVEQVAVPAKPLTWAALASRNAGGSSQAACAASARPAVSVAEPKPEQQAPLPPRSAKQVPASDERSSATNGRAMVNGNKDTETGVKHATTTLPAVYNDNQQVFVGNLPQHLTDQELIEFFEQFGSVLDFRISRKSGSNQAGNNLGQKNFGFMAFKSPETVAKVLAARPIYMGKHRLNIEEKKPKEELARSRPARFPGAGNTWSNTESSGANSIKSVANGSGPRRGKELRNDARSTSSDEGRTN